MTYLAPAVLTEIIGSIIANSYPSGVSATLLNRVTATRTGYWAFAYELKLNSPTSDHSILEARYAGTARFTSDTSPSSAQWAQGFGGVFSLTVGQTLEIWGSHSYNGGYNIGYQQLKAWFVPTPDAAS